MERVVVICLLGMSLIPLAFSQNGVHAREGRFVKRIENNMFQGQYNLAGKWDIEKLFFGEFNAQLEFFYFSPFEGTSAFRIMKKGSSYILEVKHISNFDDVREKNLAEQLKLYRVKTRSFPISIHFVEKVYQKMLSVINNFKATEVSDPDVVPIFRGGYSVTFRTVVKAELWSLWNQAPQDDALKMADLCRQIITDAKANKLDEQKYMKVLDTFED